MNKIKPLTEQETATLLVLLRKIWADSDCDIACKTEHLCIGVNCKAENPHNCGDSYIASIAKSLFSLVTKKMYVAINNLKKTSKIDSYVDNMFTTEGK